MDLLPPTAPQPRFRARHLHALYNRAALTALNVSSRVSLPPHVSTDVPKRRKRGRKGGVRERSRRMKFRTPLSTMVMGNTVSA